MTRVRKFPIDGVLAIGERVLVGASTEPGVVKFVGTTEFAEGEWIGVELDTPTGKNDGTVKDRRYFECRQGHGIFVRRAGLFKSAEDKPDKVRKSVSKKRSTKTGDKLKERAPSPLPNGNVRRNSWLETPPPAVSTEQKVAATVALKRAVSEEDIPKIRESMRIASAQGVSRQDMEFAQKTLDLDKSKVLNAEVSSIVGTIADLTNMISKLQARISSVEQSPKANASGNGLSLSWIESTVKSAEQRLLASLEERLDEKMDIAVKKITSELMGASVGPPHTQTDVRDSADENRAVKIQAAWRGALVRKKLGRWELSSAAWLVRRKHQVRANVWDDERGDRPGLDHSSFPRALARIYPHLKHAQLQAVFSGYIKHTGSDTVGVADFCRMAEVCSHGNAAAAELADIDFQSFSVLGSGDATSTAQTIQAVQRGTRGDGQHQTRTSAIGKLQRAVRRHQARAKAVGSMLHCVTAARYERRTHGAWSSIFDEARGAETGLGESTFDSAMRQIFKEMTPGQAQALYRGYLANTGGPPSDLPAFCTIATAVSSGNDRAADLADMPLERYLALDRKS